ncbi:MAG: protein TolR [Candidatus Midichloria sp.]|nr:MAG: protein TolR [Candidatus Midichloria sp.]
MHSATPSFNKYKRRSLNSEINVTPFVDVMLVLLVIFMVTSPMLLSGVEVDLPQAKTIPITGQDEPISITVDKYGNIYLQEIKVSLAELEKKLNALFTAKKDNLIFLRGDKLVDYGKIMEVFTTLKASGLYNVALVTEVIQK